MKNILLYCGPVIFISGSFCFAMLILASQSPRRRELLREGGFEFNVIPPDEGAEDSKRPNESPQNYVRRSALQKAENVAKKIVSGTIVACDTTVLCRDENLGKPVDRDDARRMLRLLRGQSQFVLSGLCIGIKKSPDDPGTFQVELETTELVMEPISDEELESYLDEGKWEGKAGAFGYQDRNSWISVVRGSESNVVGLPMERLRSMLDGLEPAL